MDGTVCFVGRRDNQVQLRGYRVELEEIEGVITRHDAVQDAAVVMDEHQGVARLSAYLVVSETFHMAGLTASLHQQLPAYMIPSRFVALDRLPRSAAGKVDRSRLADDPPPGHVLSTDTVGQVAPRDETEQRIAQLWAELLDIDDIGVYDDFFALGGHSLLATQLVSRLQEAFAVRLKLSDFLAAPSVAGLADNLRKTGAGASSLRQSADRPQLARDEILARLGSVSEEALARALRELN